MKQNITRALAAVVLLLTLLPGSIWAQRGTPVTLDAVAKQALTKVVKYPSLVQVFTNLRAASLNNHLPAFEAAAENGGTLP